MPDLLPQIEQRRQSALMVGSVSLTHWDCTLAHAVSQMGSPPVMASSALLMTASAANASSAWLWAVACLGLAVLLPIVYLVWLVRSDQVSDLDVRHRRQRAKPMVFTLCCIGLAWALAAIGSAPPLMVRLIGIFLLELLVILSITLFWKISVHCAVAAAATAFLWRTQGVLLPLGISVPLIIWSRVKLERHTIPQTIAGTLLGLLIILAFLEPSFGG